MNSSKTGLRWMFMFVAVGAVLLVGLLVGMGALFVSGTDSTALAAEAVPQSGYQAQQALPQQQQVGTTPRTITVVGEGKVATEPDVATANIGVEIVGDSVREASDSAAETVEAIIAALTAQGVEARDIQTSGYNIWVERPFAPDPLSSSSQPARDNVIYHVNNTVNVTVRDLSTVGAILEASIDAGANNIYGVSFNVADPGDLASEARQSASEDARAKAEELAGLQGVALGEVISVSEVINNGVFGPGDLRFSEAAVGLGGAGPINPGQLDVSVQLQVTYAIQ